MENNNKIKFLTNYLGIGVSMLASHLNITLDSLQALESSSPKAGIGRGFIRLNSLYEAARVGASQGIAGRLFLNLLNEPLEGDTLLGKIVDQDLSMEDLHKWATVAVQLFMEE